MWTRLTIMVIVLAAAVGAIGVIALLVVALGWLGLGIAGVGTVAVLGVYRLWLQPWRHRWGATDEEVHRPMPGDDLIPGAASTIRAITIAAPPEQVWPWLVQLGYGRAGWYGYDWIDNDGRPSADRILPELQQLHLGDQLPMLPDMGPRIREIEPNRHFVAGDQEGSTWCLALYPTPNGCRLVSRWRALAHDAGERVLDSHQRPRSVHHGAQDAQGHQGPGRARRPRPVAVHGAPVDRTAARDLIPYGPSCPGWVIGLACGARRCVATAMPPGSSIRPARRPIAQALAWEVISGGYRNGLPRSGGAQLESRLTRWLWLVKVFSFKVGCCAGRTSA